MTPQPVEAVWVWRYTKTPFKATYGRIAGTTYSKDFLQAISKCAAALDDVFDRTPGSELLLRFQWPGGSRDGKLFEAADYAENQRLNLRWETNNAPDPWKVYPEEDSSPLKTFPGDPTRLTEAEANAEYESFAAKNLSPWLTAAKLRSELDILHVRAYLGNPPLGSEHTATALLPEQLQTLMSGLPARSGCAVLLQTAATGTLEEPLTGLLFDPAKIHDAWSVGALRTTKAGTARETAPTTTAAPTKPRRLSAPYRPAKTNIKSAPAKVFARDPDEVDRGLNGHNMTQEQLAELVRAAGLTPESSATPECDYDIGWKRDEVMFVTEVKSMTDQNERAQLRLGLGQVLDYAHRMRDAGYSVQPVLAVERQPTDDRWTKICEDLGVWLVWPDTMAKLF